MALSPQHDRRLLALAKPSDALLTAMQRCGAGAVAEKMLRVVPCEHCPSSLPHVGLATVDDRESDVGRIVLDFVPPGLCVYVTLSALCNLCIALLMQAPLSGMA